MSRLAPIFFLLILWPYTGSGQIHKISELLNAQLKKELKENPAARLQVVKSFQINDNNVLTFSSRKELHSDGSYIITTSQVNIFKIQRLTKDVMVSFYAGGQVQETVVAFDPSGNKTAENTTNGDRFFTEIGFEQNNEKFRDKLMRAFKKAGITVTNDYWAD